MGLLHRERSGNAHDLLGIRESYPFIRNGINTGKHASLSSYCYVNDWIVIDIRELNATRKK